MYVGPTGYQGEKRSRIGLKKAASRQESAGRAQLTEGADPLPPDCGLLPLWLSKLGIIGSKNTARIVKLRDESIVGRKVILREVSKDAGENVPRMRTARGGLPTPPLPTPSCFPSIDSGEPLPPGVLGLGIDFLRLVKSVGDLGHAFPSPSWLALIPPPRARIRARPMSF